LQIGNVSCIKIRAIINGKSDEIKIVRPRADLNLQLINNQI